MTARTLQNLVKRIATTASLAAGIVGSNCVAQTTLSLSDDVDRFEGVTLVALQDSSPSDLVAPNAVAQPAPLNSTPSSVLQSPNTASPIEANTNPIGQPPRSSVPNSRRPNVASFGDGRFNTLSRSSAYVSPVALSLGVGGGAASAQSSAYFGTSVHRNLLRTPEMFGDFRRPGSSLNFDPFYSTYSGSSPGHEEEEGHGGGVDFPSAGSFSGMRVSENNVALPQDRIWTSYHHYHNGFQLQSGDVDLDRFIIGFEKTFNGGSSSLEFRMPIAGSLDPMDPNGNTAFAGGSFGNLDVIYKRVLLATADRVVAVGLRVETPTGSKWHSSDTSSGTANFTIDPHAVYITPYIGALREIEDIWFINSFLQVDIATGGDRLFASLNGNPEQEFRINQPPLLQIDIGGGVWLVTPSKQNIGWAAVSELHMAFALSDDDAFLVDPAANFPNVAVDQVPIRNLLNFTNGLHAQLDEYWSVRAGISVPILDDRIFDTEAMVQINRNF